MVEAPNQPRAAFRAWVLGGKQRGHLIAPGIRILLTAKRAQERQRPQNLGEPQQLVFVDGRRQTWRRCRRFFGALLGRRLSAILCRRLRHVILGDGGSCRGGEKAERNEDRAEERHGVRFCALRLKRASTAPSSKQRR